ncbi:hypothetical protein H0H93_011698 [Arthromyces matolae]|nr:hypothetical protein H0H93_011698 [Arthromyces matolae]
MSESLLELRNVACLRDDQAVFDAVNLTVNQGDVVVLRGKSGSGKTTLLKCIAHLIVYKGDVLYRGSVPITFGRYSCRVQSILTTKTLVSGIPSFRTRVFYVPQRPSLLPGTPNDLMKKITTFGAHQAHVQALKKSHGGLYDPSDRALEISQIWGIDPQLWDREWSNLSGGEAQRLALAIALGLNTAEILLLDGSYPYLLDSCNLLTHIIVQNRPRH